MGPEEISVAMALVSLLREMSRWEFGVLFFILVIGPWVLALVIAYINKKRFESVVTMYEKNVKLVENYSTLARDLKEIIIMNTQAMTRLCDRIKGGPQ